MKSLPPWRIPAQMASGLLLIVLGYVILPTSDTLHMESAVASNPSDNAIPATIEEMPTFRLSYDEYQGAWLLTNSNNQVQTLSTMIDAPQSAFNERDFLDRDGIRKVLVPIVKKQVPKLDREALLHLASLRIGSQLLFEDGELGAIPVAPKQVETNPTAATSKPVAKGLDEAFDPNSSVFESNMKAWARDARDLVKSNSNILVMKSSSGRFLRIKMSEGARNHIKDSKFGETRVDKIIYLQYLANEHGQAIDIDGGFGKGSQNAWRKILTDETHFKTLMANLN